MKKEYQKPEVAYISLLAEEEITTSVVSDDIVDGEMGLESSIF